MKSLKSQGILTAELRVVYRKFLPYMKHILPSYLALTTTFHSASWNFCGKRFYACGKDIGENTTVLRPYKTNHNPIAMDLIQTVDAEKLVLCSCVIFSCSTAIAAIFHFVPDFFPFFPPCKRTLASYTDFLRQITLFSLFHFRGLTCFFKMRFASFFTANSLRKDQTSSLDARCVSSKLTIGSG